jgi:archaellum biogenesis protein FlaJ (TadC family)
MSITNKLILTLTLLLLAATAFSQEQKNAELKHYFQQKSLSQKRAGLVLIATGALAAGVGGLVQRDTNQRLTGWEFDFTGATIAIAGGGVALAGLITLAVSAKNKRKAATLSLKNRHLTIPLADNILQAQATTISNTTIHHLHLKKFLNQ